VYRADTNTLACASCNPQGLPPITNATTFAELGVGGASRSGHRNKVLSDNGRYVFFSTGDALVSEDTNGRLDAYEYDSLTNTTSLLSSGRSTSDSLFVEASANGSDAFFVTKDQLVGWDVDNSYDFYDARVGGGFPDPVRPPGLCAGSACQGPPTADPPRINPASTTYAGVGNMRNRTASGPKRPAKCKRRMAKRRVHGKTRCVRRAKARRHRRAHARAGRGS
jgi:hypothetical protein